MKINKGLQFVIITVFTFTTILFTSCGENKLDISLDLKGPELLLTNQRFGFIQSGIFLTLCQYIISTIHPIC